MTERVAEQVVANLSSAVVVLDPQGRIVLVNAAARALGVVRGGGLNAAALTQLFRSVLADGIERERELTLPARPEPPLRLPRRDREGPAVRVRATRIADGNVALVLDDITESRRVEAIRRDFVANVSHELKTPVGALALLAEAIGQSSADPVAVRRFAERMDHEARRLTRLVQELIELSRLQSAEAPPHARQVSVLAVVSEAVDETRLAAGSSDITVTLVPGDEPGPEVVGDERQLVTAVSNLLANAVAYSPEGTRVVVGVCVREDWVEISVADEGIGLSEHDQERVFERFYRADPARSRQTGGSGIGLAIVKHIVTNHAGTVSVWSVEGAGSTFTVRLPIAGAASPKTDGSPASSDATAAAARTKAPRS